MRHTEIDRKSSQCAPALRRTSQTSNLDSKSGILVPKTPNLPPKMASMAPKMALWALLGASRACPEASPERPWTPQDRQDRFLAAILVAWGAIGLVFGMRFGRLWRPAMLLGSRLAILHCNHVRVPAPALHPRLFGRLVTPALQPCARPCTSAAPK